jgi:hypothetical protein
MSMEDLSIFCSLPRSLSSRICSSPCRGHSHRFLSSARCPSPLLWCAFSNPCPLSHALVFSSVVYSVLIFAGERISLCRGIVLMYPRVAEGYCMMLGSHLFGLLMVSQARLELAAGSNIGVVAHLFSDCIMAWRSLLWARGSGCQCFNSPCASPPPSMAPVSQQSL